MLKHCFVVLFLVLRARCTSVLQPPAPEDGSGSGGRALQLQFILQNSAELREEAECRNSGSCMEFATARIYSLSALLIPITATNSL